MPQSWRLYFADESSSSPEEEMSFNQPTIVLSSGNLKNQSASVGAALAPDSLGVAHLIRAYQVNGHRSANLDPLGMYTNESFPFRPGNVRSKNDVASGVSKYEDGYADTLTVGFHGFDQAKDMDRELNFKGVHTGGNKGFLEDLTNMPGKVTLRKVVARLRETYCQTIGVEYMHIG